MNLAYAAGILDGEGCIRFASVRDVWYPSVLVVNTCLELLEKFKIK